MTKFNNMNELYTIDAAGSRFNEKWVVTEKKTGREIVFNDYDRAIAYIEKHEKGV